MADHERANARSSAGRRARGGRAVQRKSSGGGRPGGKSGGDSEWRTTRRLFERRPTFQRGRPAGRTPDRQPTPRRGGPATTSRRSDARAPTRHGCATTTLRPTTAHAAAHPARLPAAHPRPTQPPARLPTDPSDRPATTPAKRAIRPRTIGGPATPIPAGRRTAVCAPVRHARPYSDRPRAIGADRPTADRPDGRPSTGPGRTQSGAKTIGPTGTDRAGHRSTRAALYARPNYDRDPIARACRGSRRARRKGRSSSPADGRSRRPLRRAAKSFAAHRP